MVEMASTVTGAPGAGGVVVVAVYAVTSRTAPLPMLLLGEPEGYCSAWEAGPKIGVTHTISVDEIYRTRPPFSPTMCDTYRVSDSKFMA
jgi:hypothetical protein